MKVLAINGTYRPNGNTARLVAEALRGAESEGAETEQVLLVEKDIRHCRTCYACYRDETSEIASCPIEDDVRGILEKIREADALLLASPVHGGLPTALMLMFFERALFCLTQPTGHSMGLKVCPEPRFRGKVRPVATIARAGAVPLELRHTCDFITPLMAVIAGGLANGMPVGELYAAAHFPKAMADADWRHAFLLSGVSESQLREARELGAKLARAAQAGTGRPFDVAALDPSSGG